MTTNVIDMLKEAPTCQPDLETPARGDRIFGWIEEVSELRRYPRGAQIHTDQDVLDAIYLIYRGRVEFSFLGSAAGELGAVLEAGEFFGELRLDEERTKRVYCARALEESEVWVLRRERVLELLEGRPDLLARLKGMVAYKQDLLFLFNE